MSYWVQTSKRILINWSLRKNLISWRQYFPSLFCYKFLFYCQLRISFYLHTFSKNLSIFWFKNSFRNVPLALENKAYFIFLKYRVCCISTNDRPKCKMQCLLSYCLTNSIIRKNQKQTENNCVNISQFIRLHFQI